MNTLFRFSVIQTLIAIGACLLYADDSGSDTLLTTISHVITPEYRSGQYLATIDAGVLDVDTKYRVQIVVQNPSQNELVFKGVTQSCSCFDVKTSSMVLMPDSEITLEFTAPVPKTMKRPDAFWRVRLEPKATPDWGGISIRVNYKIAGLMGFLSKRVVFEVSTQESEPRFRIPMILTSPVEAENVIVHLDERLGPCKAKVVREGNKHFLELAVDADPRESKYFAGEIFCVDSSTGIEDSAYCIIKKSSGVAVYPAILRARTTEDNESRMAISAVIRIDSTAAKPVQQETSTQHEPKVLIDATLDDKPLNVDVKRLSSFVFSANVTLTETAIESLKQMEDPKIHWLIRADKSTHELLSAVSLPR